LLPGRNPLEGVHSLPANDPKSQDESSSQA
jgi:hypothetical protein